METVLRGYLSGESIANFVAYVKAYHSEQSTTLIVWKDIWLPEKDVTSLNVIRRWKNAVENDFAHARYVCVYSWTRASNASNR